MVSKLSNRALEICHQINSPDVRSGDLRKIAGGIKKDHELALELWSSGAYQPRKLALLLMDPKQLSPEVLNSLIGDIDQHEKEERLELADWLLANQLTKDKKTSVSCYPGKTVHLHSRDAFSGIIRPG